MTIEVYASAEPIMGGESMRDVWRVQFRHENGHTARWEQSYRKKSSAVNAAEGHLVSCTYHGLKVAEVHVFTSTEKPVVHIFKKHKHYAKSKVFAYHYRDFERGWVQRQ
jgi:hypothetical protein